MLEIFTIENNRMASECGEILAKYCPKLQVFSDFSSLHGHDVNYFLKHFEYLKEVTISLNSLEADETQNLPRWICITNSEWFLQKLSQMVIDWRTSRNQF